MKFSASFFLAALPFLAAVSALPAHVKPESGDDAPPAEAAVEKPQSEDSPFVIPDEFKGVHIPDSVLDELKAHPDEMYYLYEDGEGKNVDQESKFLEYLIKHAVEHGVKKAIQNTPGAPQGGEGSHARHQGHQAKEVERREAEESSESPSPSAKPAKRTRSKKSLSGGSRPGSTKQQRMGDRRKQRLRAVSQGSRTPGGSRRRIGPGTRRLRQGNSQRPTGSRRRQGQGSQERPKRQRQSRKTSATSQG